jgi:hypothetical protein
MFLNPWKVVISLRSSEDGLRRELQAEGRRCSKAGRHRVHSLCIKGLVTSPMWLDENTPSMMKW